MLIHGASSECHLLQECDMRRATACNLNTPLGLVFWIVMLHSSMFHTSLQLAWKIVQGPNSHRNLWDVHAWHTPHRMLHRVQRGQCVLHVASSYGYPQMVKSLLQFKANADCRDEVCEPNVRNCLWSKAASLPLLPAVLQLSCICGSCVAWSRPVISQGSIFVYIRQPDIDSQCLLLCVHWQQPHMACMACVSAALLTQSS